MGRLVGHTNHMMTSAAVLLVLSLSLSSVIGETQDRFFFGGSRPGMGGFRPGMEDLVVAWEDSGLEWEDSEVDQIHLDELLTPFSEMLELYQRNLPVLLTVL